MPRVKFDDGTVINFDGMPSQDDIEEAYSSAKGQGSSSDWNINAKEIKQSKPSFFQSATTPISKLMTGKSISERVGLTNENIDKNVQDLATKRGLQGKPLSYWEAFKSGIPSTAAQVGLGAIDLSPADVATGAVTSGLSRLPVGQAVGKLLTSPIGKEAGSAIKEIPAAFGKTLEEAGQGINKFTGGLRNVPATIKDKIIQTINPSSKVIDLSNKKPIGISMNVNQTPAQDIEKSISEAVKQGISKGIRPSVVGKGTSGKVDNYYKNVTEGVKEIVRNKANLGLTDEIGEPITNKLPETVADYAKAIETSKQGIYAQYSALSKEAGEKGAAFSSGSIAKKLIDISKDLKNNPEIRQYASKLISDVVELEGATPDIVEARIKDLNRSLSGFYAGRVDQAKAEVDASVANLMRKELDNIIERATGKAYQPLKNKYGALKAAEKEVNHRANVFARGAPKNVFDLTDIFSGERIIHGVLTANPVSIAEGAGMNIIKNYFKKINSPDFQIKKMFQDVDSLMAKSSVKSEAIIPEIMRSIPVNNQTALPGKFTGGRLLTGNERPRLSFNPKITKNSAPISGKDFVSRNPNTTDYNLPKNDQKLLGKRNIKMLPNKLGIVSGEDFIMRNPRFADYIRKKKVAPMQLQDRSFLQDLWEEFSKAK